MSYNDAGIDVDFCFCFQETGFVHQITTWDGQKNKDNQQTNDNKDNQRTNDNKDNQQRELISARKTSHEHNKDMNCQR